MNANMIRRALLAAVLFGSVPFCMADTSPAISAAPQALAREAADGETRVAVGAALGASVSAAVTAQGAGNAMGAAAVGGAIAGILAAAVETNRFHDAVREAYRLEGQPTDASKALIEVLFFHQKGMPSVGWYLKAVAFLEQHPEPQLGQMFVDASDIIMRGCHADRRLQSGQLKGMCGRALDVMRSVGLPTTIEQPDMSRYLPPPAPAR